MKYGGRRLVALGFLVAVGTLAALSISTSLALFGTTGAQHAQSFSAGTVSLEGCSSNSLSGSGMPQCTPEPSGASTATSCSMTSEEQCYYTLKYTGTLDAWIGLYVVPSPSCDATVFYTFSSTTGLETVELSPTHAQGTASATPDLVGEAIATRPRPPYVFEVSGGEGTPSCSVTLSGQAVQAENNSSGVPVPPYNPLNLPSGPVAWS